MVPGAFVILDSLPLTPNGKLDRRALPAPGPGVEVGRRHEAPQGKIEAQLAEIWQQILLVEGVGREDDFFALGGHSLLAMQLVIRVAETFGIQLPMETVFECPELQAMAQAITLRLSDPKLAWVPNELEFEEGVI
jgi:syringomycin synthetase protein SyrE